MIRTLFLVFTALVCLPLSAADWQIPIKSAKKILIKGYTGQIQFHKATDEKSVLIRWQPQASKDVAPKVKAEIQNEVLEVTLERLTEREEWREQWDQEERAPLGTYHLYLPALPAELYWHSGSVQVTGWSTPLELNLQKGQISVKKSQMPLKVSVQEGQVEITDVQGKVNLHSYKAQILFKNTKGDLEVENFLGETKLLAHEGNIKLESQQGVSEIDQSQGELEFQNGRKPLRITSFEGKIKGKTDQGRVWAQLKGELNVRLQSEEGDVDIVTQNSGALVNLGTKEGQFQVASYLKPTRYSTIKIVRGRLRGEKKGYVYIRTETGKIRVR